MLNIRNEQTRHTLDTSSVSVKGATSSVSPINTSYPFPVRIWRMIQSYPIPLGSIALLLVSLVLWLAGLGEPAHWTLFTVVLLGGIPLLWETIRQFLHKEFSVDVIAIIAITGSLFLGEYLAGAFVVLMFSGGEAPIHRLADRYSIGFTIAALALAGLAWALSHDTVYALAVMVVAIMSGIDVAARRGSLT